MNIINEDIGFILKRGNRESEVVSPSSASYNINIKKDRKANQPSSRGNFRRKNG